MSDHYSQQIRMNTCIKILGLQLQCALLLFLLLVLNGVLSDLPLPRYSMQLQSIMPLFACFVWLGSRAVKSAWP